VIAYQDYDDYTNASWAWTGQVPLVPNHGTATQGAKRNVLYLDGHVKLEIQSIEPPQTPLYP
jgi:prepilin-type processing-associated H-X9-DG protein